MTWRGALLWLALVAAIPPLQVRVDRALGQFRPQQEVLYLWSGGQVRAFAAGFEPLMADVYWLRTVQYFGGQRAFAREKNFDLLRPLIDITVTLDPRFEIAYLYGAVFLSEPMPYGAGKPEEGIELLERGTKALPQSWRLHQDIGFFRFLYLKDPHGASEALLKAADLPGAPFYFRTLAATLLLKGGERAASRQIWLALFQQYDPGPLKDNAKHHLENLEARDWADALAGRVQEFHRREGRLPTELDELRRAGYINAPPLDPTGTPFEYDPRTGAVSVARGSKAWIPE